MRNFKIGQFVLIHKVAVAEYDSKDNRNVSFRDIEPLFGVITGKVIKREGTCRRPASSWYNDEMPDQPRLAISKSHILWQVKTGLINSPLAVHDDHLTEVYEPFEVPYRGKMPTYARNEVQVA